MCFWDDDLCSVIFDSLSAIRNQCMRPLWCFFENILARRTSCWSNLDPAYFCPRLWIVAFQRYSLFNSFVIRFLLACGIRIARRTYLPFCMKKWRTIPDSIGIHRATGRLFDEIQDMQTTTNDITKSFISRESLVIASLSLFVEW